MAAKISLKNNINNKINNEGKVQNIIKEIKDNEKIDNIVNKDMNAQEESFKKRLQDRKNKKLLSTSDCTEAVETVVSYLNLNINIFFIRKITEH